MTLIAVGCFTVASVAQQRPVQVASANLGSMTGGVVKSVTLPAYPSEQQPMQDTVGGARRNQVLVPFGRTSKRSIVGDVTVINPEEFLHYDNVQNLGDVLSGQVPGLVLRTIANPVVIVDGIPRDASNINVEEIEQITVLKDANAGVLYGVHAPNGVILVTTKTGTRDVHKLNFMVERGVSTPTALPSYLGSADYMRLYNEARVNDGLEPFFPDTTIANHASGAEPYRYPNVDYYGSEFLAKQRSFTKVTSEFSGGNEQARYYANVGWTNSGKLLNAAKNENFDHNRFNIRTNVDVNVTKNVIAFLSATAIFDIDEGPIGNFWSDAATLHPYYYSPLLPLSMVKSDAVLSEGLNLENARLVNGQYILGGTSIYDNNVYGNQSLGSYETSISRTIQFNQGFSIDLNETVQGLKLRTQISLDVFNSYTQGVYNEYAIYQPGWQTNAGADSIASLTRIGRDVRTGDQILGNMFFSRRLAAFAALDYNRRFGDNAISGTLLGYFDQNTVENVLVPDRSAHLGLRVAYSHKNKFYADFSGAYVNGYKLAPGNRGGLSPTLGLGWILSEEDFLRGSNRIDFLKLKASAGIINYEFSGSDYRRYERTFGGYMGNFSWDDTRSLASVTTSRAANPGLTFEKMKSINVGLEGSFLNNALFVEANWFTTRNSGEVVQRRGLYPSYMLTNIPFENYNETNYSGFNLGLEYTLNAGDFTMQVGANGMFATSKVVKRDELWPYDYQYRVGKRVGAMYGLEALGFFADAADIAASPVQMFGDVQPGDIKYKDQNDDGLVDENDEVEIGNSLPKMSYAFSLLFKYKNISLFALGNGSQGSTGIYDGSYFWVDGDDKYSDEVLNRWTPATAATATYPRLSAGNNTNNFRTSTQWLFDNNLFLVNRVQLTYHLPASLDRGFLTKGASVFLRGSNLAQLSQDAEKRQLRIGSEPGYRNYALGVRLMF